MATRKLGFCCFLQEVFVLRFDRSDKQLLKLLAVVKPSNRFMASQSIGHNPKIQHVCPLHDGLEFKTFVFVHDACHSHTLLRIS